MLRVLLLSAILLAHPCARAEELIVSAASSLSNALREVGKRFEASHREHRIAFNFASSDVLLSQIAQGAPVDVFITADTESMDRAEKQGLLAPGTRRNLLRNKLVLITPAASTLALTGLASLDDARVRRIAIGNPASVPAGRYARAALEAAGAWARLQPKFILAQNVRQALDYVARGEVDAGLVYATDAAIMAGKVRVAAAVPTPQPIVYPAAVVARSRQRALGESFVQWLHADDARAVFARHGFGQP